MPYTANPSAVRQDALMLMVGDTDTASQLLPDDFYLFVQTLEPSIYGQAALCAEALAGKYGHEVTTRVGDLWDEAKTLYLHFVELAAKYRLNSQRRANAVPFAGGSSVADMAVRDADTDRVISTIEIGMMDAE